MITAPGSYRAVELEAEHMNVEIKFNGTVEELIEFIATHRTPGHFAVKVEISSTPKPLTPDDHADAIVKTGGTKIDHIKELRARAHLSLKEAKDAIEAAATRANHVYTW